MLEIRLSLSLLLVALLQKDDFVNSLRAGGLHVCSRSVTYNTYRAVTKTRVGYDNYRTCCKRFLGVCSSRCTRYRSKTVSYTESQLSVRSKLQYFCCSGWAPQGDTCPLAICSPGCKNGKCVQPNKCQCNSGFNGKLCESDINECTRKPCQQNCKNLPGSYACSCNKGYLKTVPSNPQDKRCTDINECSTLKPCKCAANTGGCSASCRNAPGSYQCGCSFGFYLVLGKTCVDMNECKIPSINKCQQNCINRPGSFMCTCNSGYLLGPDKRSCNDINECSTLNGGCNQICNNKPGSFQCTCKPGYRLQVNQRTCIDIDECKENKPCDNQNGICRNIPGSYQCSCKSGYAMQADKKTCKDINECSSSSTNGCTQNCHNNVGSYSCSCKVGYKLNSNQRSCDDVNECTLKTHKCEHGCINNVGSYTCSCRQGYKLHTDGRMCIGLPCVKLSKPLNGQLTCTGFVTDQSCIFTCDEGYNLIGSSKRTCQPTSTWSGTSVACNKKSCPTLVPPSHGSIMLPCVELFESKCVAKCNNGYYITGADYSKCVVNDVGKTKWLPNNATCEAATPCYPNPCLHSGTCKGISTNQFQCDCANTGYKGITCQLGLITMPSFPQVFVNEESESLQIVAYPQELLEIRPMYNSSNLKFTPEKLLIYPSTRKVQFTITSYTEGAFLVQFELVGINANSFIKPKPIAVYSGKKIVSQPVDVSTAFNENNCNAKPISQCNSKLKLMSSCRWETGTNGYVSVSTGNFKLPVSLFGLSKSSINQYEVNGVLVPERTKEYFKNRELKHTCDKTKQCNGVVYDTNLINFVLKNNMFQREYINKANTLLPTWLNVRLNNIQTYFQADNFHSLLGDKNIVKNVKSCQSIFLNDNDHFSFYLPKVSLKLYFLSSLQTTSITDKSVCIGVSMCRNSIAIGFHENNFLNFNKELTDLKLDNIKITVRGLTYGEESNKCDDLLCYSINSAWNISASLLVNSKQTAIGFDGIMYTKLDEKTANDKFSTERKLMFDGSLDFKSDLRMFGRTFKVTGRSNKVNMHGKLGGFNGSSLCGDYGFNMKLDSKTVKIDHTSTRMTLNPMNDVRVYLPYNINGGKVTGVSAALVTRLTRQIRSLVRLVPLKLNELKSLLTTIGETEDVNILTKYGDSFLNELSKLLSQVSVDSDDRFIKSYQQLAIVRESLSTFKSHLEATASRNKANGRIFLTSKIILSQLKLVNTWEIVAENGMLEQNENNGQIIYYQGSICIYKLCFNNVNVEIYDLPVNANKDCKQKHSKYLASEAIVVSVTSSYDQDVSPKMRIKGGVEMVFTVKRYENSISGEIAAQIKVADQFFDTKLTVNQLGIKLQDNSVPLFGDSLFTIETSSTLLEATWKSISYRVDGISSDMALKLSGIAQTIYQTKSIATKKRLGASNHRLLDATNRLALGKSNLTQIEKRLKHSRKSLEIVEAQYRRSVVQQQNNQTTFDSYLKTLDPLFIKKNVEKVCKFKKCQEICISMPVCDICQEPLNIDVTTLKCVQKDEKIRRNVEKQLDTDCEVKRSLFIPYYTGSCKPDPGENALSEAKVRDSLIATGAAIGSLIGSVIPVLGTALGGAIGAVVGWVASMFSSCDKSMEVYEKSWFEEEPCTLLIPSVRTITRSVSICDKSPVRVQTGFKAPYTCNCKIDSCIAKSQDQVCLLKNANCEKQRQLFMKKTSKIPKKFTDLYQQLSTCNENVASSLLKIQTAKKKVEFSQRELKRVKNLLYSLEEELKLSKSSTDAAIILQDDVCIMNKYKDHQTLSQLVKINEVKFTTVLPVIENVLLNVNVSYENKVVNVPFIYNVRNEAEDRSALMKAMSLKIIRSVLCKSSRKRRSIDHVETKVNENLSFDPWFIDVNATASVAKLSCVTVERTLEFLSSTITKLKNKTVGANELKMQLQYASAQMNQAMASTFTVNTMAYSDNNHVITANQDLLMTAHKELNLMKQQIIPESILTNWQNEAEIFTGFNNMTVCLGYNDCVDKVFDTLKDLPTMSKVPRNQFLNEVFKLKAMFIRLFQQNNLNNLLDIANKIQSSISHINSLSLHCSHAPKVSLRKDVDESFEEGVSLVLRCSSQSSLPVTYQWSYNDDIIVDENKPLLSIKVNQNTIGMYTCIVSNMIGNATSNGKMVTFYKKPKFIEQPSDVTFTLPSFKNISLALPCNVTSFPQANITWIYKTRSMVRFLKDEKLPILEINNPKIEDAGYYQCIATNEFGSIKSKFVRVKVLPATLASSMFSFSFDVLQKDGINVSSFKQITSEILNETTAFKSNFKTEVQHRNERTKVSFQLHLSNSHIANESLEDMLDISSKLRQSLANAASVIIKTILIEGSRIPINKGDLVKVDNDTITYGFKLNICESGSKVHSNGFLCVMCPYGSAGIECLKCPHNTYADQLGQTECTKCNVDEITEASGSTNKMDCLTRRERRTDIMFLVDTSKLFLHGMRDVRDVRTFIETFVRSFNGTASTRYSLVTYYKYVDIFLEFNDFVGTSQLLGLLDLLDRGTKIKDTNLGLVEARNLFKKQSDDLTKKILIVITNGFSINNLDRHLGYIRTRKHALELHQENVHTISVGFGKIDYAELYTISSYPKLDNTVVTRTISSALGRTTKSIDNFLIDKKEQSSIDIGILWKPIDSYDKKVEDMEYEFLKKLLLPIYKNFSSSSFNFLWSDGAGMNDVFKTYNAHTFRHMIESYHLQQGGGALFNVYKRIEEATSLDFTELHHSFAKVKSLVVITENPLEEDLLKSLQKSVYNESLILVNFALNGDAIERTESPISTVPKANRRIFSLDELPFYLKMLKEAMTA